MLPVGTITFLFTDIEGSTNLLERLKQGYVTLLANHHDIFRASFARWNGHEIDTQGDSFFAAFTRAEDAISCVIDIQRAFAAAEWPEGVTVRVRMGLHTGEPIIGRTGYVGIDVVRAARIMASGHGGQVLLSQTTRGLVYQDLPPGVEIRDLGAHKLKDIRLPQQIYQLEIEGLPCDFPPLKTLATVEAQPKPGAAPFKGMQYFTEEDAPFFFGREEVTQRLLDAITSERFLAVIGASGSGKSSVVRAGLLPALKKHQPERWQVILLTPTAHPVESLAVALTQESESVLATTTLMDDMRKEPRALQTFARKRIPPTAKEGLQLLLVIDQFEELFTLCRDAAERQAFVDNLLAAAGASHGPVHVLITLRADFYEHLAEYSHLRELVAKHQEYLGAMSADELRRAIEEPARLGGWEFSPGLVELMLHEVGADGDHQPEPGALPLLSHALLETWKHRRGNLMSLKAYGESGGVRKAIAHTAENLYTQELTQAQQQIARNIFLRLTELGEGTQDTRRRASFQELLPPAPYGDPKDVEEVLGKLVDARLITTGEGTVEVAHEALIREWPTLREWLMQDREGLRLQRHLAEAAQEWQLLARDPGVLYRGARLAQAVEWVKANPGLLNEQEQAFLDASQAQAEQEETEKEAARQRELEAAQKLAETERQRATAESLRAEEQTVYAKRQRQRAIYLSLALAAAVIMVGVAGWFAKLSNDNAGRASQNLTAAQAASTRAVAQQSTAEAASILAVAQQSTAEAAGRLALSEANTRATAEAVAEDEARLAFSRELAAASQNNASLDSQLSLLLAMQAVKTYNAPEAVSGLHQAVQESRLLDSLSFGNEFFGVKFSPNTSTVAAIGQDGFIYLWSLDATGRKIDRASQRTLANPLDYKGRRFTSGYTLDFRPDGKWLVGVADKNSAKVWETATGKLVYTLSSHTGNVISVAFSPNGNLIVTGSMDATVKIWDAATGEELQTLTSSSSDVSALTFSQDGRHLFIADEYGFRVIVWNIETSSNNTYLFSEAYAFQAEPIGEYMLSLAVDPMESRLAVGTCSNLMVYDIETASSVSPPVLRLNLYTKQSCVNGVVFNQNGDRLYSGGSDGNAGVWDVVNGQELFQLAGNGGGIGSIAINPQDNLLMAATYGGSLNVWDVEEAGNPEWFSRRGLQSTGDLNADRSQLLVAKEYTKDGYIHFEFWDLTPEGTTKTPSRELFLPLNNTSFPQVNSDLTRLVSLNYEKMNRGLNAELWDLEAGKLILSFPVFQSDEDIRQVCPIITYCMRPEAISPDGTQLLMSRDTGEISQWDLKTGKLIREFPGSTGAWRFMFYSPDGTMFSTGGTDDSVARVWDTLTGNLLMEFKGHTNGVFGGKFSPDGKRLLTGSMDGTARLWDVQTGKEILTLARQPAPVHDTSFSPDGKYLITGTLGSVAKVWDAVTGEDLVTFNGYMASITPDGRRIITRNVDGIVRGFYLDVNDLMERARSRLIRTWTEAECVQYLHTDTCPASP